MVFITEPITTHKLTLLELSSHYCNSIPRFARQRRRFTTPNPEKPYVHNLHDGGLLLAITSVRTPPTFPSLLNP